MTLFVIVLWQLPWWLDAHYLTGLTSAQATAVSGMRTALVALGAGLLVAAGIFYTHRTLELTREGHVTDRFTRAVEQLGAGVLEVRLGGIYSLERIMHDSPKDYQTVLEVLAAFVRERGAVRSPSRSGGDPRVARARRRISFFALPSTQPSTDVQAALTVLGRRSAASQRHPLDLSFAPLEGASLNNADLSSTVLVGAHLEKANLFNVDLKHSLLVGAHLDGAVMASTQLQHAVLAGATLNGAVMAGAILDDTELAGANLTKAELSSTDFRGAKNLTAEQILLAEPDSTTLLPAHVAADERVQERIRQVEASRRPQAAQGQPA
ncbi:pentapeptide repeat-containing protein [Streptomyces platensis]|uniref:pentapeptide repeat-containing protein n=1 Tax=Streptomyces platensis TaxID=58346 RepID=UPI0033F1568E